MQRAWEGWLQVESALSPKALKWDKAGEFLEQKGSVGVWEVAHEPLRLCVSVITGPLCAQL